MIKTAVYKRLSAELAKRNRQGFKTYGKPLTIFDGRDSFLDMYEELLDLVVYFTKLKMEEEKLGCSSCRKLKQCPRPTNISASGVIKKRSLKTRSS